MKITSIEINGFKSFVDKVLLDFVPGVTALVGPNGCGKSNVADAIRWVLGEQSAKQLRGKIMEDIIFNGSETKKPLGMAEVSIAFSNENGNTPHQFSQYSEIVVTRRLFRSGESEYFINKIPCRLKDITELFLDTGVGSHSYSIIGQGRVEQIINTKPHERRLLIDEAAGISKYKSRKREALAKIESTRNNLLRVDDIISEVKRQLNSIKRQAGKLKRYQALKEEIRTIELNSSLLKYATLKDSHRSLQEQLEHHNKEEIRFSTQISSIEACLEKEKFDLSEEEKIFQRIQEEIYHASSRFQKEESRLEFISKEIVSSENQHARLLEQVNTINQRLEGHRTEITALEEKNREHQNIVLDTTSHLTQLEQQVGTLREERAKLEGAIEAEKDNLITILTELTHLNNRLAHIDKNHRTIEQKIEHTKEEKETQRTSLIHFEQELSRIKDALSKTENSKTQSVAQKSTIDEKINNLTSDLRHNEETLSVVKDSWEKANSRLLSLQELQEKFEECDAGVRSLMLRNQSTYTTADGVCGLLADVIETEPHYEAALEAVLGEKLHYVIVKSQMAGIEAIEYLKLESLGRASVVPLQIKMPSPDQVPLACAQGKAQPLMHMVNTKNDYHIIVEYLLADVLLVDTLHTALEIWNANGIKHTLVTLDGEIVYPSGIITGGRQNGSPSKILSRRREIKELKEKIFSLEPQCRDLQQNKEQLTSELSQLRKESESLYVEIHQKEIDHLSLDRDTSQLISSCDETRQRIGLLSFEEDELASSLHNAQSESLKLQSQRDTLLDSKEEKDSLISRLQEDAKNLTLKLDGAHNELTALKVQVAAEHEKYESNLITLNRLNANISLLEEEHLHTAQRSEEEEEKKNTLADQLQHTQAQIARYSQDIQNLEKSLDEQREKIVKREHEVREAEARLKKIRISLDENKEVINNLNLKLTEHNLTMEHLIHDIDEKYSLNLEQLLQHTSLEEITEDENSYEILTQLRSKIESLGEVNLTAAQEQDELAERHHFLTEQHEDLIKSLESLELAIKKINRTTKQRFLEAYQKINEKFKDVFPELFQGGKAELKLTDEDNILETGVEIAVQLPGKKLQSIDLLSGGEKTLTAIALLMSIYLIKPSPFCLLDEADAALDDLNATRFNHYLKNIGHAAQFILITHNKLTMQIATTLYGITMQEPGVSKVVSVQLQ